MPGINLVTKPFEPDNSNQILIFAAFSVPRLVKCEAGCRIGVQIAWIIIPADAKKFLLGGNHQINLDTKNNLNQTIQTRFSYLQLLWCHVWWNVKLVAELVFKSPVWMIIPAAAEKFLLGGNHQIHLYFENHFWSDLSCGSPNLIIGL